MLLLNAEGAYCNFYVFIIHIPKRSSNFLSSFPGNHLHDKTELKHTYLEEAIMNLEPDNATTKAHIGQVTKQLAKQLQEYIAKHPHEKITRSMKMLLMATESLRKNTD